MWNRSCILTKIYQPVGLRSHQSSSLQTEYEYARQDKNNTNTHFLPNWAIFLSRFFAPTRIYIHLRPYQWFIAPPLQLSFVFLTSNPSIGSVHSTVDDLLRALKREFFPLGNLGNSSRVFLTTCFSFSSSSRFFLLVLLFLFDLFFSL